MEETPSPYRWFGYMFVWMLACLLLLQEGKVSELFIFILLLVAIVLNGYCAYRFALEKWTFLAILAFVVAIALDILLPLSLYVVLLGLSWRN